jgi:hypothetical protein
MNSGLGIMLEKMRDNWKTWRMIFFVVLAVLVALNFFIHPHHPHFGLDKYPGFWAIFGCGIGLVMVLVMKKIVQPTIGRKEDYYDRGK